MVSALDLRLEITGSIPATALSSATLGHGLFRGEFQVGTRFPLLKCLRTHYRRHCEPFSGKNALHCRILHIQSQNFSGGNTPGLPQ